MQVSHPNSPVRAGRGDQTNTSVEKASLAKKIKKIRKLKKRLAELEASAGTADGVSAVDEPAEVSDGNAATTPASSLIITKSLDEERYTFGPLYTPNEVDAHGEYVQAATLTKAMRNFVRSGSRTIHKQHDTTKAVGEVVDAVVWPYPAEVELSLPGREVRKAILPAHTAYVGVVWSPEAWPLVKGGAITGYSMGGRAMRVQTGELLPPMKKSTSALD